MIACRPGILSKCLMFRVVRGNPCVLAVAPINRSLISSGSPFFSKETQISDAVSAVSPLNGKTFMYPWRTLTSSNALSGSGESLAPRHNSKTVIDVM